MQPENESFRPPRSTHPQAAQATQANTGTSTITIVEVRRTSLRISATSEDVVHVLVLSANERVRNNTFASLRVRRVLLLTHHSCLCTTLFSMHHHSAWVFWRYWGLVKHWKTWLPMPLGFKHILLEVSSVSSKGLSEMIVKGRLERLAGLGPRA